MKKIIYLLVILMCSSSWLISCQKEAKEFIDETENEETFTGAANLTTLLVRAAQNPGNVDDLIDGSDCFSLKLPITVIVNGQEVVVATEADYDQVAAILDQFPDDVDTVMLTFPLTVIFNDFTEITVQNQDEYQALQTLCEDTALLESIACVDLVYPITFFRYNASNEQTDTVQIADDEALYQFLTQLEADEFLSIQYPISIFVNEDLIEIGNNQELETALASANCSTGSGIDESNFVDTLVNGPWYVTYYFDDMDATSTYSEYEFSFAADGSASANTMSVTTSGNWNFREENGDAFLDLFYESGAPLINLEASWEIVSYTSEEIVLRSFASDGSIDLLTFSTTPDTSGGDDTELNEFIATLTMDSWFVTLLEDSGTVLTCNFLEYEFVFNTTGSATATNSEGTRSGVWSVMRQDETLLFTVNFDSSGSGNPLGDLNDNWMVLTFDATTIELLDDGSSGDDFLNFGRAPATGCESGPDPQELRDILTQGTWFVSEFIENGDDETAVFAGYDFTFLTDGSVSASNGADNVPGIWNVGVAGEELSFEIDMDSPINDADDDDYRATNYTTNTVTFVIRDSGGDIRDSLTFTKN